MAVNAITHGSSCPIPPLIPGPPFFPRYIFPSSYCDAGGNPDPGGGLLVEGAGPDLVRFCSRLISDNRNFQENHFVVNQTPDENRTWLVENHFD